MSDGRLVIHEPPGATPRNTRNLLASLIARVQTLTVISGAQALGSIISGLAELGREAATTAEGRRLRSALESTRLAGNGERLWGALSLDATTSVLPPTPVLQDLRNDVALLLAPDLDTVLAELPTLPLDGAIGPVREPKDVDVLDVVMGLWAFSREVLQTVDQIAASHPRPVALPREQVDLGGDILR